MDKETKDSTNKKITEMTGTKPKRGPGRPKGAWSYSHREIRELAQSFGPEAIGKLVMLMRKGSSEQVQAVAAKELLTRGYGNSLIVSGPNDGPIPVTYEGLTSTIHGLVGEILGPEVIDGILKAQPVQ